MNSASIDIKDYLVANTALVFATDLFVGKAVSAPDDIVTIFDTPGFPPQLTMQQGEIYNYPSIQIQIRNNGYSTGWTLSYSIFELLHGRGQTTINGTLYSLIQALGEPVFLHWDKNDRAVFIINFNIQRR